MSIASDDPARLLAILQRLIEIPAAELDVALTHAANAIAEALNADKVDAFLYDDSRDSLAVAGTSTQPLSSLQKKLGLDVLPLSNGGRVVHVYKTGVTFRTGNLLDDPEELKGVKEGLKIQSKLGVPLEVGGRRRGMVMIASLQPDQFTASDEAFAESAVRWVGNLAHRAELVGDIERNAVEQGRRAAAEELVTVLAHDLRNYISPVASRLYLLRNIAESQGREDELAHAQAALRGLSRLTSLVSDLLDVAKLDRGLFELDMEPLDLALLARESADSLSTQDHQITVTVSERVIVWGDGPRLRQCIDNLLTNAINHSPKKAPINVFVSETDGDGGTWGQVEIVDEGPGIPAELLPHIFERFVTGRGRNGGFGLGLYLAERIANAHGGDLTADHGKGKGARFVLRLRKYEEA